MTGPGADTFRYVASGCATPRGQSALTWNLPVITTSSLTLSLAFDTPHRTIGPSACERTAPAPFRRGRAPLREQALRCIKSRPAALKRCLQRLFLSSTLPQIFLTYFVVAKAFPSYHQNGYISVQRRDEQNADKASHTDRRCATCHARSGEDTRASPRGCIRSRTGRPR